MLKRLLKSFVYAGAGLRTVFKEELNFRLQVLAGVFISIFAYYFRFSFEEWIAVIVAIVLVLLSEIINTAIEDLCNKIEPRHDPVVGKVKDIMAAFVLISSIGAALIGALTVFHHFAL